MSNDVVDILEKFKPKIKKSIKNTNYQDRDDLEQEISMKIIEKLDTINFNDCPSLWKLLK